LMCCRRQNCAACDRQRPDCTVAILHKPARLTDRMPDVVETELLVCQMHMTIAQRHQPNSGHTACPFRCASLCSLQQTTASLYRRMLRQSRATGLNNHLTKDKINQSNKMYPGKKTYLQYMPTHRQSNVVKAGQTNVTPAGCPAATVPSQLGCIATTQYSVRARETPSQTWSNVN
jgi:hypothetical protein